MSNSRAVGFFDSGLGGLCILKAFQKLCPNESTVYLADSAHCPYGNRPVEEIRALAFENTRKLFTYGCKMIVVACNTATAAAIDDLRKTYPAIPFIGIEPAVKPAAKGSHTGIIGVLATAGTFNGRLYRETTSHFAQNVTILATVADEFVTLVERGETSGAAAEAVVRAKVEPLLAAGADYIVLGCTHFPHLKRLIQKVAAGRATILDPSLAVARQAQRVLLVRKLAASAKHEAQHIFLSNPLHL